MLENIPESTNIEDVRTPDDKKFQELHARWLDSFTNQPVKGIQPLSNEEETWMHNYYMLMQVKNRQGIDAINEQRGFKERFYKKQPDPHPRD